MLEKILIGYAIIAVLHFVCEYRSIKKNCVGKEYPKKDYCFYRAIFFPITWFRMMWKYTK